MVDTLERVSFAPIDEAVHRAFRSEHPLWDVKAAARFAGRYVTELDQRAATDLSG